MRVAPRLIGYLRPYAAGITVSVVLLALAGALMSAVVATVEPLVDRVLMPQGVAGRADDRDVLDLFERWLPGLDRWVEDRAFVQVPLLIVAVFLLRGLCLYFGEYLAFRAGSRVIRDLRAQLYEAVAHQSLGFFTAYPTGTIVSRLLNDVQRLQRVSTSMLADFVRVGAMVPSLLLVVFWNDWRMSLLALVALPALGYPMVRLGRRLRRASSRSQQRMAEVADRLHETVVGVRVVQSFGMEDYEVGRFRQALERMLNADLRAGRVAALSPAVMEVIGAIAGASLFAFAGLRISRGQLDGGDFTVVLVGLGLLFMSLRRLNALYVEFQRALAAAARVFDLLDRERILRDAPGARPLGPFAERIVFERVAFSYGGERVLDGVDLTIAKGEVVALVGPSGSGKTTLANLLPRFFDPIEGRVAIDGQDLRTVTLASLRGLIALVTQETFLFDDTVHANIAYGRDDESAERVEQAARAAHAHEFVARLPAGYRTRLGERGLRLSAGQRQRITIARALLKDAPILILDEATSALDAESEMWVQRALERLMSDRTCLVIAHRLSTVRRADRIVVLERGRVVEQGSHDELLRRGGVYARLHALQFEDGTG